MIIRAEIEVHAQSCVLILPVDRTHTLCAMIGLLTQAALVTSVAAEFVLLEPETFRPHFVEGWPGPYCNGSGAGEVNGSSWAWARDNLPLFEASDADMQAAYYYRAKSYHSHMNPTMYVDQPVLVSEFGSAVHWGGPYLLQPICIASLSLPSLPRSLRASLPPCFPASLPACLPVFLSFCLSASLRLCVSMCCNYNCIIPHPRRRYGTINAAAGHHISEGRWIRDPTAMNSEIKFWLGSMAGGGVDALTPHYANGSRGQGGETPYSEWIVTSVAKRAHVQGTFQLGVDIHGAEIDMHAALSAMVSWWESRTLQTRLDCAMARKNGDPGAEDCAAAHPGQFPYPFCYVIDDGWDAMEGSVSGDGCRPTIGAMKYGDALAIAELAERLGNATLATTFRQRAGWIQQECLLPLNQ